MKKDKVVAGYCRSASVSEDGSSSVVEQKKMLRRLAKNRRLVIQRLYVDEGVSGMTPNRTALRRLFRDCEDGKISMVLIPSLDRIARNSRLRAIVLYIFRHLNIQVISAKGDMDSLGALRQPWDE